MSLLSTKHARAVLNVGQREGGDPGWEKSLITGRVFGAVPPCVGTSLFFFFPYLLRSTVILEMISKKTKVNWVALAAAPKAFPPFEPPYQASGSPGPPTTEPQSQTRNRKPFFVLHACTLPSPRRQGASTSLMPGANS